MISQILDLIVGSLGKVIDQIITVEFVIVISCIIFLTEFLKHLAKSTYGKKILKIKQLEDWHLRGVSIILGVIFTLAIMSELALRERLIYGIFYGGMTSVVYWIVKRFILPKELASKLSGQKD